MVVVVILGSRHDLKIKACCINQSCHISGGKGDNHEDLAESENDLKGRQNLKQLQE